MRAFQNDTHCPHWTTRTEDTAVYVIFLASRWWMWVVQKVKSGAALQNLMQKETHVADLTHKADNFFVLIHTYVARISNVRS